MITYDQDNAYEVIQNDIEGKFHLLIGKSNIDIKTICIVGAYHGYEIVNLLNNYPNATLHAFEAYPEHFDVLSRNFGENSRVILYNKVVSDKVGDIEFFQLTAEGNGSIHQFQGDKYGHPLSIKEKLFLPSTTLKNELGDINIDLLWIDVQGAELNVLKGVDTERCASLFLEIHTHDFIKPWDEEPYKGQCYKEDLENYLKHHIIHSIGLDNASGNGQGNSFWVKR
jgi:FkbM family methyltransferase